LRRRAREIFAELEVRARPQQQRLAPPRVGVVDARAGRRLVVELEEAAPLAPLLALAQLARGDEERLERERGPPGRQEVGADALADPCRVDAVDMRERVRDDEVVLRQATGLPRRALEALA